MTTFYNIKSELERMKADFLTLIKYSSGLDLETRWKGYCELGNYLLGTHYCYTSPENALSWLGPEICWYDDYGIDRYQTLYYDDWVDSLAVDGKFTTEQLDELREWCMATGTCGFVNDW